MKARWWPLRRWWGRDAHPPKVDAVSARRAAAARQVAERAVAEAQARQAEVAAAAAPLREALERNGWVDLIQRAAQR